MAQPLPTASMSAIVACRAKLVGILNAYAGRTIAGDAYLTLCRELAGVVLRGGKSSAVDQFDTGLDHREDASAVYRSVQALVAGKTMTPELAKTAAFRMAGNMDSLRAGREVTEFLGSIMSNRLPTDVAERARRLLRLTDELESVSDECAKILKVVRRLRSQKQSISNFCSRRGWYF